MNLSSLPNYPTVSRPSSHHAGENLGCSSQRKRVHRLWDFTFLVGIALLLGWLRWMATEIKRPPDSPPKPLDFQIVKQRYSQIRLLSTREEVEQLLGPSTNRVFPESELQERMKDAEHNMRHVGMPKNRVWDIWSDPKDDGAWVAVLYANGRVYHTAKKGWKKTERGQYTPVSLDP